MTNYPAPSPFSNVDLSAYGGGYAPAPVHTPYSHEPVTPMVAEYLRDLPHAPMVGAAHPSIEDPWIWRWTKNFSQFGLMAIAVLIALTPGQSVVAIATAAVSGLLGIVVFVVADRQRFVALMGDPHDIQPYAELGMAHAPDPSAWGYSWVPAEEKLPEPYRITVT